MMFFFFFCFLSSNGIQVKKLGDTPERLGRKRVGVVTHINNAMDGIAAGRFGFGGKWLIWIP